MSSVYEYQQNEKKIEEKENQRKTTIVIRHQFVAKPQEQLIEFTGMICNNETTFKVVHIFF